MNESISHALHKRRCQRLNQLLELLAKRGINQQQVATRANVPVQYLSNIKSGRRPLTELVARRLAEEFDFNFEWLLGTSDEMTPPTLRADRPQGLWLPVFRNPFAGEPLANPAWDGKGIVVTSIAGRLLAAAQLPYILRFEAEDQEGRLQLGDHILISQAPSAEARIGVVRFGDKLYLARRNEDGTWKRVAKEDKPRPAKEQVGHCVGIVWSAL